MSFFEDGKPAPSIEEIAEALGTTFGSVRGLLGRLRKKTGRELKTGKSEENSKKVDEEILSLFKDVKNWAELMANTDDSFQFEKFKKQIIAHDQYRNLDFTQTFPELAQYI